MNVNKVDIKTKSTDRPQKLSKQEVINYLLYFKHLARKTKRQIESFKYRIEQSLKTATLLNYSIFNSHQIDRLAQDAKYYKQLKEDALNSQFSIYEHIVELMRLYDQFDNNTNHEKAQLLSISHITFGKFLNREHSGDGSLLFSASMHAECYGEKESFIGESGNRDYPLFNATNYVMMKAMRDNKEMQQAAQDMFTKTFGEMPMYQHTIDINGAEVFERAPPKLTVVKI